MLAELATVTFTVCNLCIFDPALLLQWFMQGWLLYVESSKNVVVYTMLVEVNISQNWALYECLFIF